MAYNLLSRTAAVCLYVALAVAVNLPALSQNWLDGAAGLAEGPNNEWYVLGEFPPDQYPDTGHTVPDYSGGGCGTVKTPITCHSTFFARISSDGRRLLHFTILPRDPYKGSAAVRLAVDRAGNALVAEIQYMGGFGPASVKIHRIGRDGRRVTAPDYFPIITGIAEAPDGKILLTGYERWAGGYLGVLNANLGVLSESINLPFTPRAMAVGRDGTVFVGTDADLRKYAPRFARELATVPLPGPVIHIDVRDDNVEVVGAEGNSLVYREVWDSSLKQRRSAMSSYRYRGAVAASATGKIYFARTVTIDEPVPLTRGALQACRGMGIDEDLDAAVVGPDYGTFLAGTDHEVAIGLLARENSVTVAGLTWSKDFPHPAITLPNIPARLFVRHFKTVPELSISPHCVVNAASLVPGPVVPGGLVTIFGVDFSSPVTVTFDGIPATVLGLAPDRVNVQVPELNINDKSRLRITSGGAPVGSADVRVARAHPGIFTVNGLGTAYAIVLNEDGTPNSAANPARAGSPVTLFATGIHPSAPPVEMVNYAHQSYSPLAVVYHASGIVEIRVVEAGMAYGFQIRSGQEASRPVKYPERRLGPGYAWTWEPESNVRLHVTPWYPRIPIPIPENK